MFGDLIFALAVVLRCALAAVVLFVAGMLLLRRAANPALRTAWIGGGVGALWVGMTLALMGPRLGLTYAVVAGVSAWTAVLAVGVLLAALAAGRQLVARDPQPARRVLPRRSGRVWLVLLVTAAASLLLALPAVYASASATRLVVVSASLAAALGVSLALLMVGTVAVLLDHGSERIDLTRCLAATRLALSLYGVALLLTGGHQLAAAGYLPMSPQASYWLARAGLVTSLLALVGVLLPTAGVLFPGRRTVVEATTSLAVPAAANPAAVWARRLAEDGLRTARLGAALLVACLVVIALGEASSAWARQPYPADQLELRGEELTIPLAELSEAQVMAYQVVVDGAAVRFLVTRRGLVVTTVLDLCRTCGRGGWHSYSTVWRCRVCADLVADTAVGQRRGGCVPLPLASTVRADHLVVLRADLVGAVASRAGG